MINKQKVLLLPLWLVITVISCISCGIQTKTPVVVPIEGLELKLDEELPLEIGKTIDFTYKNKTEDLIVFPPDHNVKTYIYDEDRQEWVEVENFLGRIDTIDDYVGIQPSDISSWFATPIIENKGKAVKVKITIQGNIYKGSMTEFEERGITDEVVTGSLEVILEPAQ